MAKAKNQKQPIFASRQECEEHPRVRNAIKPGNILDRRIPILWLEMKKAETLNYAALYEAGEELFGSPNNVMALRKIANAETYKSGKFWIPINACSAESLAKAELAYKSKDEDRYDYASNKAYKIGKQSLSVEQFVECVARSKRGGKCAFYLMELRNSKGAHYWKTGIAGIKEQKAGAAAALDRLKFQRDRMFDEAGNKDKNAAVLWHCLITDIANGPEARKLEAAAEKAFGDICRLKMKNGQILNPQIRRGKEQFRDHPRMRLAAKLLRPLTCADALNEYGQFFAETIKDME